VLVFAFDRPLASAGRALQRVLDGTIRYRLVSYWLPIPAGGVAYLAFRRRYP
jgi:uncharacterized membrane protein YbhN (UPF0104 family)